MSGLPSPLNPESAAARKPRFRPPAPESRRGQTPPPATTPFTLRVRRRGRRAQLSSDNACHSHTPATERERLAPPPRTPPSRGLTRPHSQPLPVPFSRLGRASLPQPSPASSVSPPPPSLSGHYQMEGGEPREPREPREPGPGAETAAAPRWEEAKAFSDTLAPKKKPKSVNTGHGCGGREGESHRGWGRKPPGEGPVVPLQEGTQVLSTRMRPAVGAGSGLFWELCSVFFFFPGLVFHARIPLPQCCHLGAAQGPAAQPLSERAAWGAWTVLVGSADQWALR